MSNNELQLFVFEGSRAESKYVEKLEQNFLGERISVKCVYDAEIYQLYKSLEKEDLNHKCPMVAVLSAFPIYILDYFGVNTLKKKLDSFL